MMAKLVRRMGLGSWLEGFEEWFVGGKSEELTGGAGDDAPAEEGGQEESECRSRVCQREGCSQRTLEAHVALQHREVA